MQQMVYLRLIPHQMVRQHHIHIAGDIHTLDVQRIHYLSDALVIGITQICQLATTGRFVHRRVGKEIHVLFVQTPKWSDMETLIIIKLP